MMRESLDAAWCWGEVCLKGGSSKSSSGIQCNAMQCNHSVQSCHGSMRTTDTIGQAAMRPG